MSWPRQGFQKTLEIPKFEFFVLDFVGLGLRMPREAWRLPSPQMLHYVLIFPSPPPVPSRHLLVEEVALVRLSEHCLIIFLLGSLTTTTLGTCG